MVTGPTAKSLAATISMTLAFDAAASMALMSTIEAATTMATGPTSELSAAMMSLTPTFQAAATMALTPIFEAEPQWR